MGVVGAGEDVGGAGEVDGEADGARVEVHRVVVELLAQIGRRRARDMDAAVGEGAPAAVEPLRQIRNRAAQVSEHPANLREALDHAAEDESGSGQRGVKQEADERHQPVVLHGLDAQRICGMDVEDGGVGVGALVEREEARVVQRCAVDVAVDHHAAQAEFARGARVFDDGGGRVVERQRRERSEAAGPCAHDGGELVVDGARQFGGALRRLDHGARAGEAEDVMVNAGGGERAVAMRDVAMARDNDVDVAGRVQFRVAVCVVGDANLRGLLRHGFDVLHRVKVVVDVDDGGAHSR